jgi:hypothetical protein
MDAIIGISVVGALCLGLVPAAYYYLRGSNKEILEDDVVAITKPSGRRVMKYSINPNNPYEGGSGGSKSCRKRHSKKRQYSKKKK